MTSYQKGGSLGQKRLFFFFFFLGLHLRDMEVPRLGVELQLQLPAYSNTGSKPHLRLTSQLRAIPDP